MATTENQPPEQQSTGGHSERLLKAQAAELAALRERVADLPDPDTLTQWRASHERLSQLQADLPAWRQQLQEAHQAERQQLQQTVEDQQQALTRARFEQDLQREYLQAGGIAAHWPAWLEIGAKGAVRTEDGTLQINGKPLSEALTQQREDTLYGAFYHPKYGSGGGARSGSDVRVTQSQDLTGMRTGELFRQAFTTHRGPQQ